MTTKQTDANGNILVQSPEIIEIPASYADFALAAGLPHDASKSDVLAAMGKAKAEHASLLEEVGAKNVSEALGKISGERATHASLVIAIVGETVSASGEKKTPTTADAIAKMAADRKTSERAQVEQLIGEAKAAGKTAGDKAMAFYEKHGMEAFKAHIDALPVNAALVATAPQQKPSSTNPAQPSGGAPGSKIEVKLTKEDEKRIKASGRSREEFIEARRAELEATRAAQGESDDSDDDE